MYVMEQFIQASILLFVLTVVSVIQGAHPCLSILLCGLLMVVFTIRSLTDNLCKLLLVIQLLCSVFFVMSSGVIWTYLVLYECRGNKRVQRVLPSAVYFISQMIIGKLILPQMLLNSLFLLIVSEGIILVERLMLKYRGVENQTARIVSVMAVNEMYEKKLNQELVIKNYLADKNARLEERENISRNIHNSVGHTITAAIMTLDAADMLFDTEPDRAREKMNTANQRIRDSLNEIRHVVRVLDSEREAVSQRDFIDELTADISGYAFSTMEKVIFHLRMQR